MDVTIQTARLVLRPPREGDIPAIVACLGDFEVARYLSPVPHPYSEENARAWLATLHAPVPGTAHFAIDLPGEGAVGVVGIRKELGYWLNRRFHGRGLMTEACAALLDWHFAARPSDRILSSVHADNVASLRVQQELGFVETGERAMRHVRSLGHEVEHVLTSLIRPQFEARIGGCV